jgi:hypothetical protein
MNNILYIYGYGSSTNSNTYQWLKHNLTNDNVYCEAYDQSDPETSVPYLCEIVLEKNINIIIGSSFGGWYAFAPHFKHKVAAFADASHQTLRLVSLKSSISIFFRQSVYSGNDAKQTIFLPKFFARSSFKITA